MSKGKAMVAATVVAVAVVGWRFIESVLTEAEEELDREDFRAEPTGSPAPAAPSKPASAKPDTSTATRPPPERKESVRRIGLSVRSPGPTAAVERTIWPCSMQ